MIMFKDNITNYLFKRGDENQSTVSKQYYTIVLGEEL